jgi:hypothetical protein
MTGLRVAFPVSALAATAAVLLGLSGLLGAAACTNGTTPNCADAACGYPLPDAVGAPGEGGAVNEAGLAD